MGNTIPPKLHEVAPQENPREQDPILAPTEQAQPGWREMWKNIEQSKVDGENNQLLRNFRFASQQDPDLRARAEKLGLDLGTTTDLAEQDMDGLRALWEEHKFRTKIWAGGDTTLMRQMLDPNFARVAYDDLSQLSLIEGWAKSWDKGQLAAERSEIYFKQSQNGGALSRMDQERLLQIEEEMLWLPQDTSTGGWASPIYGMAMMGGGMWKTMVRSAAWAGAGASTALVLGQAGPQAAFMEEIVTVPFMAGRMFLAGLANYSGQQIAGEVYGEMMSRGIPHEAAKGRAEVAGMIGGALEAGSVGFLGGRIAAKALASMAGRQALQKMTTGRAFGAFATDWAKGAGGEIGTELAQTYTQWLMVGDALKAEGMADDREGLGEDLTHTFWETLRGVAILSSFGPTVQLGNRLMLAQQGRVHEKRWANLHNGVKDSKLAKRSEDRVHDFLAQAVGDHGSPKNVYFDLDKFIEVLTENNISRQALEENAPEVMQAVRDAEAGKNNGQVVIPTATYGSKFLSLPELGPQFNPHAKASPEGVSLQEADERQEQWIASAQEKLKSATEANEKFGEEVKELRRKRFAQLMDASDSQKNKITKKHAAKIAELYSLKVAVFAAANGVSPREAEAIFFGRVKGGISEPAALDQTTPEFVSWFGGSKVLDDDGAPLVVYHGTTYDFTKFDPDYVNTENYMGRGFYFSDSPEDSGVNYADPVNGPDLKNRTYELADQIAQSGMEYEQALEEARKQLVGEAPQTMPVYLSLKNPADLRSTEHWDFHEPYDEETDTYEDPEGRLWDFVEALREAAAPYINAYGSLGTDDPALGILEQYPEGATLNQVVEWVKTDSELQHYYDDDGNAVGAEIFRYALELMGYDGVIHQADIFPGMDHVAGTTHYIAFRPEQIKSVFNRGTYDIASPDILEQPVFFSALEQAVKDHDAKAMSAGGWKQFLKGLVNKKKIREREVFWSGIEDWLDLQEGKVRKEDVVEYLQNDGAVRVIFKHQSEHEMLNMDSPYASLVLRHQPDIAKDGHPHLTIANDSNIYYDMKEQFPDLFLQDDFDWASEITDSLMTRDGRPKWPSITVKGEQENYREVIFVLPNPKRQRDLKVLSHRLQEARREEREAVEHLNKLGVGEPDTYGRAAKLGEARRALAVAKGAYSAANQEGQYTGGHWGYTDAAIHLRITDRTGPNGESLLFIEEVQSDASQQGRKHGFSQPLTAEDRIELQKLANELVDIQEEANEIRAIPVMDRTPDESFELSDLEAKYDVIAAEAQGVRNRAKAGLVPYAPFISAEKFGLVDHEGNELKFVKGKKGFVIATEEEAKSKTKVEFKRFESIEEAEKAAKKVETNETVTWVGAQNLGWKEDTKGWTTLALKKVMLIAAEGNYDAIVFANGRQNAAHYNLRDHVEQIVVPAIGGVPGITHMDDGVFRLEFHMKDSSDYRAGYVDTSKEGNPVHGFSEPIEDGTPLEDVVHPENAKQILDAVALRKDEMLQWAIVPNLERGEAIIEAAMEGGLGDYAMVRENVNTLLEHPDVQDSRESQRAYDRLRSAITNAHIEDKIDPEFDMDEIIRADERFMVIDPNGEPARDQGGNIMYFLDDYEAGDFLRDHLLHTNKLTIQNEEIIEWGGEGMLAFYDTMIPNTMRGLLKKGAEMKWEDWGEKVDPAWTVLPPAVADGDAGTWKLVNPEGKIVAEYEFQDYADKAAERRMPIPLSVLAGMRDRGLQDAVKFEARSVAHELMWGSLGNLKISDKLRADIFETAELNIDGSPDMEDVAEILVHVAAQAVQEEDLIDIKPTSHTGQTSFEVAVDTQEGWKPHVAEIRSDPGFAELMRLAKAAARARISRYDLVPTEQNQAELDAWREAGDKYLNRDEPSPKDMATQFTVRPSQALMESIKKDGLPLQQGNRGQFSPSNRVTELGPDANASTALHEMMHEYFNALLLVANQKPEEGVLAQEGGGGKRKMDILAAIGAMGGLDRDQLREHLAEARDVKHSPLGRGGFRGKPAFRAKKGKSLDKVAEQLQADGWLRSEDPMGEMLDLIAAALRGEEVWHPGSDADVDIMAKQEAAEDAASRPQSAEEEAQIEADMEALAEQVDAEQAEAAAPPRIPPEMQEQLDAALVFFGMKGDDFEARLASWNALSFAEQRPHHEALSYRYELWLFTGDVPSAGLKKLFQKLRDFMLSVYTSLTRAERELEGTYRSKFGRDLPGMTNELREMFERMASGEQLARNLEATNELAPLFSSKEEFIAYGYDAQTWDRYQEMLEEWRQDLITDLNIRSLRAMEWQKRAKGRVITQLKKKHKERRKAVRKDVEEAVRDEPIYQLIETLRREKLGLNTQAVMDMLGDIDEQAKKDIKKKLGRKLLKDGYHPDDIADLDPNRTWGSGKELVAALIAAKPLQEEIDLQTDEEMKRRYGNSMSDEAIDSEVMKAIHSEARARFVAAELKFLEKTTSPVRMMVQAARRAAQQTLTSMTIREISVHRFSKMEAQAAREAEAAMQPVSPRKASKDGKTPAREGRPADPRAAMAAKQRQLYWNQMAFLATEVVSEIDKAKRGSFKQAVRGKDEDLAERANHVYVARALLAAVGLAPEGVAERVPDFLRRMAETQEEVYQGFEADLDRARGLAESSGGDYRDLTLDEFVGLKEKVEELLFLARRDQTIEIEGRRQRIRDAVAPMLGRLASLVRKDKDLPGQRSATKESAFAKWRNDTGASLTKAEHYLRWLDEGEIGPFTQTVFLPVKESLSEYRQLSAGYVKQLVERIEKARSDGLLPDMEIPLDEIRVPEGEDDAGAPVYVFGGKDTNVGGMTELIGALLHMGNDSNRLKFLVAGRGTVPWATVIDKDNVDTSQWDAFIQRLINDGTLTKEHFQLVQDIWNILDAIKPLLQRTHVRMKGYAFKEVQPNPLSYTFPGDTKPTTWEGGYVPAAVDYNAGKHVGKLGPIELTEEDLKNEFFEGLPRVADSMTQERQDHYRERPLSMDLQMISAHIDKALRYAIVAPAALDAGKVLTNKEFAGLLAKVNPRAYEDIFKPFLERAVTQSLYKPGNKAAGPFFKHLRKMAGVTIMAGNVVNTLQQLTGLANAAIYVPPRYMKTAVFEMMSDRGEFFRKIAADSKFMDDRMNNQMFDLYADMKELSLQMGKGERFQDKAIRLGYIMQATMQNFVDAVVWKGAYARGMENLQENETLEQGHARAAREADQAVRLSQGSFSPEDVAAYDHNTPFWRAFTQFTGYFNTLWNQLRFSTKEEQTKAVVLGFMIPMIVAEAIAMYFYGKFDDDDDDGHVDTLMTLLVYSQIRGGAAMLPGIGSNITNVFEKSLGDRAYGDKIVPAPAMSQLVRAGHGILGVIRSIYDEEKELRSGGVRDALTAIAMLFPYGGVAVSPLIKPLSYSYGRSTGEFKEPDSYFTTARQALSGRGERD